MAQHGKKEESGLHALGKTAFGLRPEGKKEQKEGVVAAACWPARHVDKHGKKAMFFLNLLIKKTKKVDVLSQAGLLQTPCFFAQESMKQEKQKGKEISSSL